jgi:hypothetical protein
MANVDRRELLAGAVAALSTLPGCDDVVIENFEPNGSLVTETTGGLPVIQAITSNGSFYVYQCCGTPEVPSSWSCVVRDPDGNAVATITEETLAAIAPVEVENTLQCIGSNPFSQLIGNAVWGGAPLVEVLAQLGVTVPGDLHEVGFKGHDEYVASVPASDLDRPLWLVWQMNGAPLPREHGAPARIIAPSRYGVKNVKWIAEIALSRDVIVNFWDPQGWNHEAPVRVNGFILVPQASTVATPPIRLLGTAFAGTDPVVRVEVRVDDGTWVDAVIDYSPGPHIWTLWHHDVALDSGGHSAQVRVTTASGAVSNLDPEGSGQLDGYDGGQYIEFDVA